MQTWLKGGLPCLTIATAPIVILLWLPVKACERACPDKEAQRIESPDARYVVTHSFGDNCGGATVAFSHSVRLSQAGKANINVLLIETYRSPTAIDLRWIDSRHLEVVARGMRDVRVLHAYSRPQWEDVTVTISLIE
jgi:hypothetical protein